MIMKFKESSLLKKHKQLLGNKRDKRKKVVKSTSPTPDLKKAVIKKQEGGTLFSIYNSIDPYIPPAIDFNAPELETEIVTNPIKKRQAKVIEEAKKSTTNSEAQELKEINSEVPSKKIPKSSETWKSPYSNKNEWVSDLTNAYKKAGITNDNAIRMLISQDALESGWGRSAQGKFNFGNLTTGSSWKGAYVEGKDHDAKGNPIKQRFRAYDSMDEYAADKIQFLKRLYDFDENDDIDKFISKLSGANKGKRRYAEATNYATSLANVYNKFAEGGIIKAQNGSKSEELLIKKALEFGQKTSEKMSPYDVRLIDFIKSKEGFRPKPEKDKTDGKWTVGYGLTDPRLIRKYRNGITEEEASKHLIQHLQMGADSLATMPYYDNLNLGEKTALNDLIYNVGWNKFKNSKRLQSHLKTGNDAGAKKEMNHGEHQARGLKIRRNQNRQMYDSTFNWKYKKGGVAKYQEPAQGIQRRDAVADYRPAIPLSPIKRTYTQTSQPILSQDNRNRWQHEQASKQADRGYNDYMEAKKTQEGLNNLNGFLNFTDVMGLGTGIAALLGKGVKYAGKQAIKRRLVNAANSTSPTTSTSKFSISKEVLPDYAKPNWQGDELALTKDRLANGGFDRLQALKGNQSKIAELQKKYGLNPRNYDYSYDDFSPEGRKALLEAQPRYGKAIDFRATPDMGGLTRRAEGYFTSLFDDAANRTPANVTATEAHEYSHFVFDPDKLPPMDAYDFDKIPEKFKKYYKGDLVDKNRGMEITARGTQIKNYFGLKEGQPITEDMLKYAAENYVKDKGVDNGMNIFFGGIKDYKKMAEWLTEWSPAIATPVIGNKMINDNDKIK